ncbi:uncharacterized protein LOC117481994 [Trematomus bernacchii]|uniref:uncharacterized protein LOC117481994 n=1 Tax=Trematomus bernacchii TaxID=40690 RepID=UPI00146C0EA8|nr:uncharacterized protein LOC117481994 [Trematomus bernacchii]
MSLKASGFVFFLLSMPVVQGHDGWAVTYTPTEICAFKGSTVEINCTYTYPAIWEYQVITVKKTFWFTQLKDDVFVDLNTDLEYTGRVVDQCENNICTLRVSDLRESDSAEYKFRIETNHQTARWADLHGVTLSVPDLQVNVHRSDETWSELRCQSSCQIPGYPSYIWYKNGEKIQTGTFSFAVDYDPADSYSCTVNGHENHRSPPVCTFIQVSVVNHLSVTKLPFSYPHQTALTVDSNALPGQSGDIIPPPGSGWQTVFPNCFDADRKSFSVASWNSFHTCCFASDMAALTEMSTMIVNVIRITLGFLILIPVFLLSLWTRQSSKKETRSFPTEARDPVEIELDSFPKYENDSHTAAQTEDTEEQGDMV